jgi:hypothetical protein
MARRKKIPERFFPQNSLILAENTKSVVSCRLPVVRMLKDGAQEKNTRALFPAELADTRRKYKIS